MGTTMGFLLEGQWRDDVQRDKRITDGRFVRTESQHRNWVTADGSPGLSGTGSYKAEPNRYHLYIAYACPWAHRTLIFRRLKGLERMIGLSVVHWFMGPNGWTFEGGCDVVPDTINGARYLHELYTKSEPHYSGRATVPVLWDKDTERIVNNESSEIIRMFNVAFDAIGALPGDYYPEALREQIDTFNERIYHTLNNGVYKAGFARTQEAYEAAVYPLFETMDWLEGRLANRRYLVGDQITEADWRLFPTLLRFDPVYVGHFKCNIRRLVDYPNLWAYTRDLYQHLGIAETVNFYHIKQHYYRSHESVNPTRVVPAGPVIDFDAPHDRERLGAAR